MLRTTSNNNLGAQATENNKNQDVSASASRGRVGRNFENLLTAAKLAKSKKSKSTKSKKLDLTKGNFAKINSGTDFLTPKAKKAFTHQWKAFTEAPILRHFNPEYHIRIETDALGYTIGRILSQMILDQHFSGHLTHEDLNSDFPKSEISQ